MDMIDVEEQNILTAIFKDAFPDSWQNDPHFVQYLADLSSFGVEKLGQEPDRLSEEKCQILEETQNLAFQNYKTFIQTAECSREIFEDFQIIENHVEQLLTKLPEFSEQCNSVLKKAQDISSSRRMNTLTLQRHTQLLEILELPQLMDTCVRNGYYDEALELASHVKRLEKKHATIPVIWSIVDEVKLSTQLMLNQLIQQLRTNVQLPACLRVIGYLRRMDVFTEAELRIKFLQARDAWFQGILAAIPKEDAYVHINKTIEASRVNLFDIITQYRAIFSDEDPLLSTSKDTALNEAALFHGWIVQKVSQFLATLEADLARGVGGRLDSILGQCMYFGLSFSRVGADFRGLLTPIFQRAALNGLRYSLAESNKRFEENMRTYTLLSNTSTGSGAGFNPSSQSGQLYPPTLLLDFQPLAEYCNDILSALNELRLCAPVALVTDVANCLHDSFVLVNKVILAFQRAEETTFDHREREKFHQFCAAYGLHLVPYINRCLQTLFPPTQLAQILGVAVSDIHKMDNLGQVNVDSALSLVKHLVPEVEVIQPVQDVIDKTPLHPQLPVMNPDVKPPVIDTSQVQSVTPDVKPPFIDTSQVQSGTSDVKPPVPNGTPENLVAESVTPSQNIVPLYQEALETPADKLLDNTADVQTPQEAVSAPADIDRDGPSITEDNDKTNISNTIPQTSTDSDTKTVIGTIKEVDEDTDKDNLSVDPIKFSLGDTDEETDLYKPIVGETETDETQDVGESEFDIESDLSALAADVLGTKSKDSDTKKKAD